MFNITLKEYLLYALMFMSLLIAIVIPLDSGFWGGMARGALLTAFIYTIPHWLKAREEDGR